MHPTHGAGEIVDMTEAELVDGYDDYYVIQFTTKKMKLFIPVERSQEVGLRAVMNKDRLERVWETLRDMPQKLPKHFRSRKAKIEEMLHSGRPTQVAQAVRELTWRRSQRDLCKTDSDLLSKAKKRLKSEVMLSMDSSANKAEQMINEALAEAVETKNETMQAAA